MILISNNLCDDIEIPSDTVVRINIAWCYSINEIKKYINRFDNKIFLDIPIKRIKQPNNQYTNKQIKTLIKEHKNIQYLGISNVESPNDITAYLETFPDISIVPKIETIKGIENIDNILQSITCREKLVMLDHEDLHNDMVMQNISPLNLYTIFINKLQTKCNHYKVKLLKTAGIVFST